MTVPPEYLRTRLRTPGAHPAWPTHFVIVSGWAPTGEIWTIEKNEAADDRLRHELRSRGLTHHRITGYDGTGDHAEPSWAVECSVDEGIVLGRLFRQLAVFEVVDGELWVLMTDGGEPVFVDQFLDRLDDPFSRSPDPSRKP